MFYHKIFPKTFLTLPDTGGGEGFPAVDAQAGADPAEAQKEDDRGAQVRSINFI